MHSKPNRRILIVDDNAAIHQDFKKILGRASAAAEASASASEAALFGDEPVASSVPATSASAGADDVEYTIDSAMQGQEALERVVAARQEQLPYAMAFLDVRMPPGWDGVETARRIFAVEPDLQIVICTAFSDYSWSETVAALGRTDRLLILKKPFDRVEVCQLAAALTEKWNLTQRERESLQTALRAEMEAKAYAASLETTNRALKTAWAQAERELDRRREFFTGLASNVLAPAQRALLELAAPTNAGADDVAALRRLDTALEPAANVAEAIALTLELVELDAGHVRPSWDRCDPGAVLRAACEHAAPIARLRGVELRAQTSKHVPQTIESDPARLRRLLDELLQNAVRHCSGAVEVELDQDPEIPSSLRFVITDDGPGMEETALSHLFEPFNPAAAGGSNARAGLGLVLCKRTAALLQARLDGENASPHGARFTLSVPLQIDVSR
jgi:signal transduction histidine kinase